MVLGWTCAFFILDPHVLGLKSSFGFWGFGFLCSWSCFIFQFACFCCLVFTPILDFVISMKFSLSSLLNLLSLCLFNFFFFCNLIMGCSESICIVEEWYKSHWWYTIGNFICKRGGTGWDGVIPKPAPGFKKNLIPVPNSFIKFKPRLIKGGYPKKSTLLPSLLKSVQSLDDKRKKKFIYLFPFSFWNKEKLIKNLFNHKNIDIRYVKK